MALLIEKGGCFLEEEPGEQGDLHAPGSAAHLGQAV